MGYASIFDRRSVEILNGLTGTRIVDSESLRTPPSQRAMTASNEDADLRRIFPVAAGV